MSELATVNPAGVPAERFRWRDREGGFHTPEAMVTRHLFHTVSMIWNHAMPPEAQTHQFRQYEFPTFYTPAYMRTAIKALLPELLARNDLRPEWRRRLDFMRSWISTQHAEEVRLVTAPRRPRPRPQGSTP